MLAAPLVINGPELHMKVDRRRNNKYHAGELITEVEMDQSALECFYCARFFPFCCCKQEMAEATYMNIYTNAVEIGQPMYCCCFCCCSQTSVGMVSHFDDPVVWAETAVRGEICAPFPFCCVNACDCCGEVLVMRGKCCSGGRYWAMGNNGTTCTYCPCIACCMPISVMYGLAPGEAQRAASIINGSVSNFRSGNWPVEGRLRNIISPPTVVVVQQMGAPMYPQQQQMGQPQQYSPMAQQAPPMQQQEPYYAPPKGDSDF